MQGLPTSYPEWRRHRDAILTENLVHSDYTVELLYRFLVASGPRGIIQKTLIPPDHLSAVQSLDLPRSGVAQST